MAQNSGDPRNSDFIMMFRDIDYTTRIRRAGLEIGVLERDLMERANPGGRGDSKGKPPWRAYYKARNHVRMAIDRRSPLVALGCAAHLILLLVRACVSRKRGLERARMLVAGARDGMLGRMGRTLNPPGSLRPSE